MQSACIVFALVSRWLVRKCTVSSNTYLGDERGRAVTAMLRCRIAWPPGLQDCCARVGTDAREGGRHAAGEYDARRHYDDTARKMHDCIASAPARLRFIFTKG